MAESCYTCRQDDAIAASSLSVPLSEQIYLDEPWRVAHAVKVALPGWLVVVPRRHVTSIAELTVVEAAALGPLLHRVSRCLHDVVGCAKTYVMQFAEAEGFAHAHFHVVPRMPDLPREHLGPGIFHYLTRPRTEWLSAESLTKVAAALTNSLKAAH
jgi:diadenosine tetraphosphate (Ap4A) HIT family hydrolase